MPHQKLKYFLSFGIIPIIGICMGLPHTWFGIKEELLSTYQANSSMENYVIERPAISSYELVKNYPPRFRTSKKFIFDIICPPDKKFSSTLEFVRYNEKTFEVPENYIHSAFQLKTELSLEPMIYDSPDGIQAALEWHLNFADAKLFHYYSSNLFAQDEIQVMEHPVLGSLKDYLEKIEDGLIPWTIDLDTNKATPFLIRNVERHGSIQTNVSTENWPYGIYGNYFHQAPLEVVRKAVKIINPPTISNIIAMKAPSHGHGFYTHNEILAILSTAFTSFSAARHETERFSGEKKKIETVIRTGNWGTGAFGGNKVLMALLQLIAAEFAAIDLLVFHSPGGGDHFEKALDILKEMRRKFLTKGKEFTSSKLISWIVGMKFQWGVGDGN